MTSIKTSAVIQAIKASIECNPEFFDKSRDNRYFKWLSELVVAHLRTSDYQKAGLLQYNDIPEWLPAATNPEHKVLRLATVNAEGFDKPFTIDLIFADDGQTYPFVNAEVTDANGKVAVCTQKKLKSDRMGAMDLAQIILNFLYNYGKKANKPLYSDEEIAKAIKKNKRK